MNNLEPLSFTTGVLERMRENELSVLMALAVFFVYRTKGNATQPEFARRYNAKPSQVSLLFQKLSKKHFIFCAAYRAPRGRTLSAPYKFYRITENGLSIINKLLCEENDQTPH